MSTVFSRFATAALLTLAAFCRPGLAENKFVPPEGTVLLMAGQNRESTEDYVAATGIAPGGVMFYTSVRLLQGLEEGYDTGAGGELNAKWLLETYPRSTLQIGLYMVDLLDDIAAGVYDRNIDTLAEWIKAAKRPVYLRIGYEFDGPHNHYDPKKYVKAYRYIVKRFRKKKVDNVAYVWHSYASTVRRPLTDWYPGHAFVDWFGISYFNQHESLMKPMAELAAAYGKPLMIAESTPAGVGTAGGMASWRKWFKGYFNLIAKYNVKCACYINDDWDSSPMFAAQRWGNSRLSLSEELTRSWLAEITQPRYLNASDDLFRLLGYEDAAP